MSLENEISHPGVVEKIDKEVVTVKILSASACASCSVKGICNMAEMQEKIIEVRRVKSDAVSEGDHVNLIMTRSMGTKAVVLGYIIPFFIVIVALIILTLITDNEAMAGIASLLLVVPYYLLLYRYRDNLKKTFDFSIQKIN